jgi:DNA-binding XRE family transcriptional regulator
MTNDLTIAKGSLLDVANQNKITLAETFIHCDGVAIVDISSSMTDCDSRDGKSRFEVAREELKILQENFAGKLAIVAFSDDPQFCPAGVLPLPMGSTALDKALIMAKMADVIPDFKFFVISDGEPNSEELALSIAQTYQNPIHTIFVGSENGHGREFLRKLSNLKHGIFDTSFRAAAGLSDKIAGLLGA